MYDEALIYTGSGPDKLGDADGAAKQLADLEKSAASRVAAVGGSGALAAGASFPGA